MSSAILFKYLHLISVFVVFGCITGQYVLLKSEMTYNELKKVAWIDAVYGVAALTTVVFGLLLWFVVGKPATFYNSNPLIYVKVGLFFIVGLLSLRPTIFFFKARKQPKDHLFNIPSNLRRCILIELIIMLIIPIFATMMAVGYGN